MITHRVFEWFKKKVCVFRGRTMCHMGSQRRGHAPSSSHGARGTRKREKTLPMPRRRPKRSIGTINNLANELCRTKSSYRVVAAASCPVAIPSTKEWLCDQDRNAQRPVIMVTQIRPVNFFCHFSECRCTAAATLGTVQGDFRVFVTSM